MKSFLSKNLLVGICLGIFFILVTVPMTQAENSPGKSLQTNIIIRSMTEKEKKQADNASQRSIKPNQSTSEQLVSGTNYTLTTIATSGEKVANNIVKGAKQFSKTNISKNLQKVSGFTSRTTQKIVKNGKSNLKLGGKVLAGVDKVGTGASVLGSISGGDLPGVVEGVVNGGASGLSASAASAGAVFLASAGSAAIYGAPLGPIGMAVTATVGGIAGSIIYNEVAAPQVQKIGDWAANEISDSQQTAANKKNRTTADLHIVYPNGVLGAKPEDLDPKNLRSKAQAILDERKTYPSVPSTYGLDRDTAKQTLTNAGFSASASVGKEAEDAASENKVYFQSLKPGHKAKPGTAVSVVVYGKYISTTIVPNAIGFQARYAGSAIRGADLVYNPVVGDPAGEVGDQFKSYSQDPVAGTEVTRKTSVKVLLYSKFAEKEITVPSVKGLSASEAQISITTRGLTAIFVTGEAAPDPSLTNTVKSQTPGAGTIFKNKGTVIVTLYDIDEQNALCQQSESLFSAALGNKRVERCREILSEAVECPFYASAVSRLERQECLLAQSSYNTAVGAQRFSKAKAILAQYSQCEFALGGALAALKCEENKSAIRAMLQRNNLKGVKSVLSRSQNCSYYASYVAALAQAEQNMANNQKNQQLFWQALGGVIAGLNNASAANSTNSSGTNAANTGPPVVHQGTCNDVRKAGGDRPEQHIIDIGRTGKTFRFDYQTHSQEDMVIVSQGSKVLFNSGCVGTGTTKTIVLKKKAFKPEVTVDIRPNCKGGSGTAWEFKVHCPE